MKPSPSLPLLDVADMEEKSFCNFADIGVVEGEEHVADIMAPESGGHVSVLSTDDRVPGRLLGRHREYEKIGAEPYIVRSESNWHIS